MVDRSLLPPAQFEFVVLSDTHYMLDPGPTRLEFESRRRQSRRAERALQLAAALEPAFVVHLGDLVQEFPGRSEFEAAVEAAVAQMARCGLQPRLAAGNHDVGDKPDPTMPTDWVTSASLAAHHARFGPSWFSWEQGDLHCVMLNSQIMNSALPEAAEQRRWLAADLAAHTGRRTCLFLHLPPFLVDPDEPHLGHYDNIGEPDRSWLLQLCQEYEVELLCAAHVHFAFVNQLGPTRCVVVPSPAFTRPGFGEIFSSAPAAEQGRDDAPKLGFYLVRVHTDGARLHFVRSGGQTEPLALPADENTPRPLITGTPADLPASRLGIGLRHALAQAGSVPVAWPSAIRQPMRNDYGLLACLELGIRQVRVPAADLADPLQAERLAILRAEGVQITAAWLWSQPEPLAAYLDRHRGQIDRLELQLPGTLLPPPDCLQLLRRADRAWGLPVTLATLGLRQLPGKQHSRTQLGYTPEELVALNQQLADQDVRIQRALCRIEADDDPWQLLCAGLEPLSQIAVVTWLLELAGQESVGRRARVAAALFAAGLHGSAELLLEPLVDLDRTMDVCQGLLDRLYNPRPLFHLVRTLNTLLFARPEVRQSLPAVWMNGHRLLGSRCVDSLLWLAPQPDSADQTRLNLAALPGLAQAETVHAYALTRGTVQTWRRPQAEPLPLLEWNDTLLLVGASEPG